MSNYNEFQRKPNRRRHRNQDRTRNNQRQMYNFSPLDYHDSRESIINPQNDKAVIMHKNAPNNDQESTLKLNNQSDSNQGRNAQLSMVLHKPSGGTNSHQTTPSIGSTNTTATGQTNRLFYASVTNGATPKAHTWKSQQTKQRQNFNRMVRLVGFIAPEQFHKQANPAGDARDIVPDTFQKYCEHEMELVKMREVITLKNVEGMKAQIATHKASGATRSKFGEKGKVYDSCYSPVLCQPTVWSAEYKHTGYPQASWPRQSELQFDGDIREQLTTRCGRFLPPPRIPAHDDTPFYQQPFLTVLPLDQTGPIYACGPTPIDVMQANKNMDEDAEFELAGKELLGSAFVKELGAEY